MCPGLRPEQAGCPAEPHTAHPWLKVILAQSSLTLDLRGAAVIDLRDFSQAGALLDIGQQCAPTFGVHLSQAWSVGTGL